MEEIWKDVAGFEGCYQVSSIGRVRSLDRETNGRWGIHFIKSKMLSLCLDRYGYLYLVLKNQGKKKYYTVHRLVAINFLKNDQQKGTVNHKNGIKTDNRVENLEWATVKENNIHAIETGLRVGLFGEKNPMCSISEEVARDIKYGNKGLTQRQIAKKHKISFQNVHSILSGKIWKHI